MAKSKKEEVKPRNEDRFGGSTSFGFGSRSTMSPRSSFSDFKFDDDLVEEKPKETVSNDKVDFYKSFKLGTKVFHKSFGTGEVIVEVSDFVGAFVTIKFETVGVKTLSLKFAPLTILN